MDGGGPFRKALILVILAAALLWCGCGRATKAGHRPPAAPSHGAPPPPRPRPWSEPWLSITAPPIAPAAPPRPALTAPG